MGYTIAEKILARATGLKSIKAGDEIMAKPDYVIAYDFPGYTDVDFKQMRENCTSSRATGARRTTFRSTRGRASAIRSRPRSATPLPARRPRRSRRRLGDAAPKPIQAARLAGHGLHA